MSFRARGIACTAISWSRLGLWNGDIVILTVVFSSCLYLNLVECRLMCWMQVQCIDLTNIDCLYIPWACKLGNGQDHSAHYLNPQLQPFHSPINSLFHAPAQPLSPLITSSSRVDPYPIALPTPALLCSRDHYSMVWPTGSKVITWWLDRAREHVKRRESDKSPSSVVFVTGQRARARRRARQSACD